MKDLSEGKKVAIVLGSLLAAFIVILLIIAFTAKPQPQVNTENLLKNSSFNLYEVDDESGYKYEYPNYILTFDDKFEKVKITTYPSFPSSSRVFTAPMKIEKDGSVTMHRGDLTIDLYFDDISENSASGTMIDDDEEKEFHIIRNSDGF